MSIKVRVQIKGDIATMKILIKDPDNSSLNKSFHEKPYISEVSVFLNNLPINKTLLTNNISNNPYLVFKFVAYKRDEYQIVYTNSLGVKKIKKGRIR